MADVSAEPVFAILAEDTGLIDDNSLHEAAGVSDDIDFDLGGVEANNNADPTIDDDVDDIRYEDVAAPDAADAAPGDVADGHSPLAEVSGTNANDASDANKSADEVDYGVVDSITGHDVSIGISAESSDEKQQPEEEYQQQAPEVVSEEIGFDFELHGGENVVLENEGSGLNETLQEDGFEQAGSANGGGHEDVPEEEHVGEDEAEEGSKGDIEGGEDNASIPDNTGHADVTAEEEEGPSETDMQMHSEMDHGGSEDANGAYEDTDNNVEDAEVEDDEDEDDEEQEEDEAGDLLETLDTGLGLLGTLHSASSFDVTVTWGDQVCPLFKAPGVDDPDMFYLEDAEALNYPLSKFLQTVRGSIASWVNSGDEIFIRVDDLGLEFGETTTEALLNQVTFHNLLALHSTLSKNDDPETQKGVHIILDTRPNCLFRLCDLVTGASLGKGLSVFQKVAESDADESSEDSGENEDGSNDLSPDVEEEQDDYSALSENDANVPAPEDEGGDTEMTDTSDDVAADNTASAEGEEEYDGEADEGGAEEGPADEPANEDTVFNASAEADVLSVVQEEAGYVAFANEEDGVDATHSAIPVAPDALALNIEAEHGDEPHMADGLLDETTTGANNRHDDLDVWGDFEPPSADNVEEGEGGYEDSVHLQPANGTGHESQQNSSVEDILLDVSGDDAEARQVLEDEMVLQSAADLDTALDSSATATVDHDEIDYEDNHAALGASDPVNDNGPDADADEIDWDDEIKNAVSDATTPSLQTTGKRSREADESGDALLDDSPDPKRQRAEDSSI